MNLWVSLGKYVGGKTFSAILVVAGGASLIWFWRHPEQLAAIWGTLKSVLAWSSFVIVLPWATFFIPLRVVKLESNPAAVLMLVGYAVVDVSAAFWLSSGGIHGALTWIVLLLGFLAASVYNFLVCDYLAERAGESA